MEIGIDFGPLGATLGTLLLLLALDTILGVASAVAGGTFKMEFLYAVGRTKGLVMFQIAALLLAGAATPFADFNLLGLDTDPFTLLGLGLAGPLALSLLASIQDNIGKKDETVPQGVTPETPVA